MRAITDRRVSRSVSLDKSFYPKERRNDLLLPAMGKYLLSIMEVEVHSRGQINCYTI